MALQDNRWVDASELSKREWNTIRGKLCSVIEAMGLPEKQERATVALIKQLTYESQETVAQLLKFATPDRKFRIHEDKIEVYHPGS